jgi:hypothetical protein
MCIFVKSPMLKNKNKNEKRYFINKDEMNN